MKKPSQIYLLLFFTLVVVCGATAILLRVAKHQSILEEMKTIPMQISTKSTVADQKYAKSYSCANALLRQVPFSDSQEFQHEWMENDFFFILDMPQQNLYIYTPYFAGKTTLLTDKNGQSTETTSKGHPAEEIVHNPNGSIQSIRELGTTPDDIHHNIRIPYHSTNPLKSSGYYYFTVRGGINLSPLFIAGDAQDRPDFQKITGPISQTSMDLTYPPGNYHSLPIEDKLWDASHTSFDPESLKVLSDYTTFILPTLDQNLRMSQYSPTSGLIHTDEETQNTSREIHKLCGASE